MPESEPPPPPPSPPPLTAPSGPAAAGLPLIPADPAKVASALTYALRFDERGRPRRLGPMLEVALALLGEQLAAQLERSNFVVCQRPPRPPHST